MERTGKVTGDERGQEGTGKCVVAVVMETGVVTSMWAAGGVAMETIYLATCAARTDGASLAQPEQESCTMGS